MGRRSRLGRCSTASCLSGCWAGRSVPGFILTTSTQIALITDVRISARSQTVRINRIGGGRTRRTPRGIGTSTGGPARFRWSFARMVLTTMEARSEAPPREPLRLIGCAAHLGWLRARWFRRRSRVLSRRVRHGNQMLRDDSSTGFRGVWFDPNKRLFRPYAGGSGNRRWGGAYRTAEEAAVVAHSLRLELGLETDPSPAWLPRVSPARVVRQKSSVYRGVTWSANRGKWTGQAHKSGRGYSAGRFDSEIDAARAAARKRVEIGLTSVTDEPLLRNHG